MKGLYRRSLPLALLVLFVAGGVASGQEEMVSLDASVLDDELRTQAERDQDEHRKPIDVYSWVGIQPGMTVGDVYPGTGYNTHLLSKLVGEDGRVVSVLEFIEGLTLQGIPQPIDVIFRDRVTERGLDNVEIVSRFAGVPDGSLDAVVVVRNYHDVEWVFEEYSREETVAHLLRCLKPGGVVGLVDVATDRPGWDEETHRLNAAQVIEDFQNGGFELAETSDMLANPDDDHSVSGFQEGRYKMDRYLLKFRKPVPAES
jgi:predicted methyltransferase